MSDFTQQMQKMMQMYMQPQTQMQFPSLMGQNAGSLTSAYGNLMGQVNPATPQQPQSPAETNGHGRPVQPILPANSDAPQPAPLPQQPQQPQQGQSGKGGGSSQGSITGALKNIMAMK